MHRPKLPVALIFLLAGALGGCSTPLFAGLTLGEVGLVSSLFTTAATGKGLGEHAMDAATGRDCRILEGLAREDRRICERENSPAAEDDWQGLAGLAGDSSDATRIPRSDMPPRDGRGG